MMHKERYDDLLLRFAKELHDVGVTEDNKKLLQAQTDRHPNTAHASNDTVTDRFVYQYNGYMIEAIRSVKLTVKTCK